MAKAKAGIAWTIEQAARECGVDNNTLSKRLTAAGIKPDEAGHFTTRQIFSAVMGDYAGEKLRKVKEEADKLELDNRRTRGELISVEDAITIAQRFAAASRQVVVMSKLSPEEKNEFLSEMRALAEVDWSKVEGYFDEED